MKRIIQSPNLPISPSSTTMKLLTTLLLLILPLLHAEELAPEKRELLSSHSTVAKFTGIKDHVCRGATGLCPDKCGSSGKLATFEIIEYLAYEKPGEYGDPKQTTFQILIKDNQGNAKISAEILATIESLKPDIKVKLSWNHDYVTKDKSSSPERPITKIELEKSN